MSDELDRTKLPMPTRRSRDRQARRSGDSTPDWDIIGYVTPPGAPNILLVLIDDAGFGQPSTFGGPIATPDCTRMAERGLRYNGLHVTAMCSLTRAALLTGRNHHTVGYGSVGGVHRRPFPGYSAMRPRGCARSRRCCSR